MHTSSVSSFGLTALMAASLATAYADPDHYGYSLRGRESDEGFMARGIVDRDSGHVAVRGLSDGDDNDHLLALSKRSAKGGFFASHGQKKAEKENQLYLAGNEMRRKRQRVLEWKGRVEDKDVGGRTSTKENLADAQKEYEAAKAKYKSLGGT